MSLELDRVPDPARRPEPAEKLALDKLNTWSYLGQSFGQPRAFFGRLDGAWKNVVYASLE